MRHCLQALAAPPARREPPAKRVSQVSGHRYDRIMQGLLDMFVSLDKDSSAGCSSLNTPLLAGASGSTGQTGGTGQTGDTGQTGVTGEWISS